MREITQKEFDKIYEQHQLWLESDGKKGERAELANTGLRNIKFPQRANLEETKLNGADLYGADLREADLREVNLLGASLQGAIGIPPEILNTYGRGIHSSSETDLPAQLNQLKAEKEQLEKEDSNKAEAIANIKYLDWQIKNIEDSIEKKTEQGQNIETNLDAAFQSLAEVSDDLIPDFRRLNGLFFGFSALAIACGVGLICLWLKVFEALDALETYSITRIWLFASPSLILVGFIAVSIMQVNRAQRQLQSLKIYSRKYKIIQTALTGYYGVEDRLKKTPAKAQEVFESIIEQMNRENVNIELEEERLKVSNAKYQ